MNAGVLFWEGGQEAVKCWNNGPKGDWMLARLIGLAMTFEGVAPNKALGISMYVFAAEKNWKSSTKGWRGSFEKVNRCRG